MPLLRFLPEATNINFVGFRYVAFALDGLLLIAAIVSIAWHGFNLGIDFTGGVLLEVKSAQTIDIGKLRGDVDGLNFGDAQIQYFGGGACDTPVNSCAMIRIQPRVSAGDADQNAADQRVTGAIKQKLGSNFEFRNTQVIGPRVSNELLHDGVYATLLAIAMIAIYVSVRFEWQYGIGAAVATGHDVLVTAGLYSILGLNFDLNAVAALLTLAGYSINDTVVVFDRIRENRRKFKRMGLGDLINLSTNQMLTRTILTSVATAVSLIPLLIFGGPALFDFSAAILFGIVVGTFSSIYVAASLLLYLPAPAGQIETKGEEATAS
ncbi:MAG: protein translocase subunit SecF [Alphaproteobacteria bacterium]|nr:protein translocase subunit SecF [Alphaproteobacteria bacterium]